METCTKCNYKLNSYTHNNNCPIGIIESENGVEIIESLFNELNMLRTQRDEAISKLQLILNEQKILSQPAR